MYEQVSHALLNDILLALKPDNQPDIQYFYTRLGANFYAIHSLFFSLYGERDDFKPQMQRLVKTMLQQYEKRPQHLKQKDLQREKDHQWFLSQKWVAMALYCDGFADDLKSLPAKLHYLQELGINMLHIMPICDCPDNKSDGGYAVRDFRQVDQRFGNLADLDILVEDLRHREILLTLDVVMNHTSDQHEWAKKARQGDQVYQDYFFVFDDRRIPDIYEASMPEVFPEIAPGSFTWDNTMNKWVMTVFNHYQWDLNYKNPTVFIEMLDIILYWANRGADILRLDAVAFLWKKLGSTCQNEREAHLILQMMKDCCQVTAPGVIFIAEAIVAPNEIIKYFGEDAINAKECEIAYNATMMALLWDAVATKNTRLLNQGIQSIPDKLENTTWLNYIRCHDDIGLGFNDVDIVAVGYQPAEHRRFLVDYYTGCYAGSNANGLAFGVNIKTGDARISGSLASLAGLDIALKQQDANSKDQAITDAIKTILLLHSVILSFGGIPLLYYGDEIGTLNDDAYLSDADKMDDNRWVHRPNIDWDKAERRKKIDTVEYRIFTGLKQLIAARKEIPVFADVNNREVIQLENEYLFAFSRSSNTGMQSRILVISNFSHQAQLLNAMQLKTMGFFQQASVKNLCDGEQVTLDQDRLTIPPLSYFWLAA